MPEIKPLMTMAHLLALNINRSPLGDRRHRYADLPGVTTDAKMISEDRPPATGPYGSPDATGFDKNRELARRIKQVVRELKPQEGGGISSWRGGCTRTRVILAFKPRRTPAAAAVAALRDRAKRRRTTDEMARFKCLNRSC
jgi:hypothetical protein